MVFQSTELQKTYNPSMTLNKDLVYQITPNHSQMCKVQAQINLFP
jgi:hypothetical protein